MEFIKHICDFCKKEKKFRKGAENEILKVCGDCWNWDTHQPQFINDLTKKQ